MQKYFCKFLFQTRIQKLNISSEEDIFLGKKFYVMLQKLIKQKNFLTIEIIQEDEDKYENLVNLVGFQASSK